jgi:Flp pilus assembly protein TadD
MDNTEKLQQQISREKWRNYEAAQAGRAGTPASREVATFIASYERTHGKASESKHVETPAAPGPQTRAALKVAAAIARARAGDIAEASSRAVGVHKLPTYRVGGRS